MRLAVHTLQVFSILPQENCVRFCKCMSTDMSAWHFDMQLVWIKTWQSSEVSSSTVGKSIYRNTCTWQQKTKPKRFSAGSQKLSVHGAEMMYFQLLKRASHTFFHSKISYKWLLRSLKMGTSGKFKLLWQFCWCKVKSTQQCVFDKLRHMVLVVSGTRVWNQMMSGAYYKSTLYVNQWYKCVSIQCISLKWLHTL